MAVGIVIAGHTRNPSMQTSPFEAWIRVKPAMTA
jgi:hypothetical protein